MCKKCAKRKKGKAGKLIEADRSWEAETFGGCWGCSSSMSGAMGLVVGCRMMFGAVVGPVFGAFIPVIAKLALRFTAAKPVKTVVHGFGLFLDDGVVDDTDRSGVVSLD